MRRTRLTSLLAFAVIIPVLIASCTLPENAEASGILKCKCHSKLEVDPDWSPRTDFDPDSYSHPLMVSLLDLVRIYGDPLNNKTKQD